MSGHESLAGLGWTDWFEERTRLHGTPADAVARVAAVDRDQLLLVDGTGEFRARLSGGYLHRHQLSHELPCVGDWVCVARDGRGGSGLVQALLERRTALRRKAAGSAALYQMIAANVDTVIVVQSCHFDFNVNRLERYLVMVRDSGAAPCVLLTKTDLVGPDVLASQLADLRTAGVAAPVLTLSNVTGDGVDGLRRTLRPARTHCFVGSSGVGKSTIINGLTGRGSLATRAVSASGEGRHTTVRRELVVLPGGALVIDNPGMRELGILDADGALAGGFADIVARAAGCRYRDCSHTAEPGCAVRRAVEAGEVDRAHYENFLRLREESDFYGLSYAEKRKKDRDFGRFLKSAKQDLDRG